MHAPADCPEGGIPAGPYRLRRWSNGDVPALAAACQDSEIARWLRHIPQPYTEANARAFVTQANLSLATGVAMADTKDKKIALSNNYAGNSWRQAMLKSWEKVTSKAVADKIVAAADPFTTAENQVTEQAAQIQNLVLQGYNAIVLNAASPDALKHEVEVLEQENEALRHQVEVTSTPKKRRGRTIGYPTANLATTPHAAIPADGVYAARLVVALVDRHRQGQRHVDARQPHRHGAR